MAEEGLKALMDAVVKAMSNIDDVKRETGKTSGTIGCPKCGGTLHWVSHSPRAMRMWCETADCDVRAMG